MRIESSLPLLPRPKALPTYHLPPTSPRIMSHRLIKVKQK